MITIQPSEFVDYVTADGTELTKLPYPFFVDEKGIVGRQDVWSGTVARVVGFAADLAEQRVDLTWHRAVTDLQKAVGMYLVTEDSAGTWSVHTNAVASITEE
jgi:hypothetical protein